MALGTVNVPGVTRRDLAEVNESVNEILRMIMKGEVVMPLCDQAGQVLCTEDGTAVYAVKKL